MKIRTLLPLLSLAFAGVSTAAATDDSSNAQSAKAYTLFEGENISVGQGGSVHAVRDVNGGSWVIMVDGQPQLVSAKNGPISMKIGAALKLTDVSADIEHLKGERAYTYANDPAVRFTRNMNNSAALDVGAHAASNQSSAAGSDVTSPGNMAMNNTPKSGPAASAAAAAITAAQAHIGPSQQDASEASGVYSGDLSLVGSQDGEGDFDALDVSFDISSEKKLDEPYFVVTARFHDRSAAPGASQSLIYAKALEPIGGHAVHVKFEQAGFPPGYSLVGFEMHLYDRGVEIATNVAQKRKLLTSEEAFDYVKSTYIAAHKGDTLPASPIMGKLPDDLTSRIAEGKYGTAFYVRVSKDGMADGTFSDAACSTKIDDPYLDTVVSGIRFKPALAKGNPVEGVATLNLSRLRI